MALKVYYPGYYLSNLHVHNVLDDLKDSMVTSTYRSRFPDDIDIKAAKTQESSADDDKYTPEHLKKLLNIYRPYYPLDGIPSYRPRTEVKKPEPKIESPSVKTSRFGPPRMYGAPIHGMPQTLYDRDLNDRLQNLIYGELCPMTISAPTSSRTAAVDDSSDEASDKYKQYLLQYPYYHYMYPYLLSGYTYPYTRWLMLRRELARVERENEYRRLRAASSAPKPVPSMSKALSEPNLAVGGYGKARSGYPGVAGEEPAYDFRDRPWEYMKLLRRKDIQREL